MNNYKPYYSHFLKINADLLHMAAHSHHYWPDITREAVLEYWEDSAKLTDEKWGKVFKEVIPQTQQHIADILGLKKPEMIALAPNTHELVARLFSCFLGQKTFSVLTTDSEFHSFSRQLKRLEEIDGVHTYKASTSSLLIDRSLFIQEMIQELKTQKYDLCFVSQVFFNSGLALTDDELDILIENCPEKTLFAIDGYHAFGAIPTSLSKWEGRIFYFGGGYKYAQAGEGVGFVVVPDLQAFRPAYTGWFAEYGNLTQASSQKIGYSQDGMSFMGATQDPSGFYRMNKVWSMFKKDQVSVANIHSHVKELQKYFIASNSDQPFFKNLTPLFLNLDWHGHFLTYSAPSEDYGNKLRASLRAQKVFIDQRGTRLRFGMGMYHGMEDLDILHERIKSAVP